jgi:hypothetical protein
MAFLSDLVLDQGLNYATANGTKVFICSQEPTTYAEASATYALGSITVVTGAAEDGDVNGRKVVVGAATGGSVTADGTASHYGLTNGVGVLIATKTVSNPQAVTTGNAFSTEDFDVAISDAT